MNLNSLRQELCDCSLAALADIVHSLTIALSVTPSVPELESDEPKQFTLNPDTTMDTWIAQTIYGNLYRAKFDWKLGSKTIPGDGLRIVGTCDHVSYRREVSGFCRKHAQPVLFYASAPSVTNKVVVVGLDSLRKVCLPSQIIIAGSPGSLLEDCECVLAKPS